MQSWHACCKLNDIPTAGLVLGDKSDGLDKTGDKP
jgi:hypothetical protein